MSFCLVKESDQFDKCGHLLNLGSPNLACWPVWSLQPITKKNQNSLFSSERFKNGNCYDQIVYIVDSYRGWVAGLEPNCPRQLIKNW